VTTPFLLVHCLNAIDGDIASASVAYQLQLTTVPTTAALPLFFSGLIALVFKNRSGRKTFI
jgi:hypothetical protein